MRKSSWRKKYQLPPGYIQDSLFQEDHEIEKKPKSKMILHFFSVIFIVALLAAYLTQQIYLMNLNNDIAALEKELTAIHYDNERLRLAYTQAENLAYVEQIAIHKLGMVRPRKINYLENTNLTQEKKRFEAKELYSNIRNWWANYNTEN